MNRTHVAAPHAPGTQEAPYRGLSSSPIPTYSSAVSGAASGSLADLPLCGVGEGVSFQGASGMHEGCGNWSVIAPGVPCLVLHLGEARTIVSRRFAALVLQLLTQGASAVNGLLPFPGGRANHPTNGVAPHHAHAEATTAPRGRRDPALSLGHPGKAGGRTGERSGAAVPLSPSANGGETATVRAAVADIQAQN